MAMEVCCGQCRGRLLVEVAGAVVACPHCGVHLSIPDIIPKTSLPSVNENSANTPNEPLTLPFHILEESAIADEEELPFGHQYGNSAETLIQGQHTSGLEKAFSSSTLSEATEQAEVLDEAPLGEFSAHASDSQPTDTLQSPKREDESKSLSSEPEFPLSFPESRADSPLTFSFGNQESTANSQTDDSAPPILMFGSPEPLTAMPTVDSSTDDPSETSFESGLQSLRTVDNNAANSQQTWLLLLLIIVGSYASILTLYLVYLTFFVQTHPLESLPDLKTAQQEGGRVRVPRPENNLPPGHELKLGQSQRYGNIRVTPLRITKGPLKFSHYTGEVQRVRPASEPVLKLWLKIENVSATQSVVPVDTTLMFFRRGVEEVVSYNVIFREEDRKKRDARRFYNFDRMAMDSEFVIMDQHTNESLAPQTSFETFIPSEEGIDELNGTLIWRIHLRKGYGPETGNGVTTLVDVHFAANEIQAEPT